MASIHDDGNGTQRLVSQACYLAGALSDLDAVVECARQSLAEGGWEDCDTLIGRGLSGALVVPFVARAMELDWAIVRKPRDGTHSSETIEGIIGRRWVFMDDLISSGSTLRATILAVHDLCYRYGFHTRMLGCITYAPRTVWKLDHMNWGDLDPNPPHITGEPSQSASLAIEPLPPKPLPVPSAWVQPELDYVTNPFMQAFNEAMSKMPTFAELAAELRTGRGLCKIETDLNYWVKWSKEGVKSKPVPKAPQYKGKTRRTLVDLYEMQAAQRAALQGKADLFTKMYGGTK